MAYTSESYGNDQLNMAFRGQSRLAAIKDAQSIESKEMEAYYNNPLPISEV